MTFHSHQNEIECRLLDVLANLYLEKCFSISFSFYWTIILKPENGEIILLYSTSRQDNNKNREVEDTYIYWGEQRMEAESKRKWDFFLMLYYVSQNDDLIESFFLCHGEKTYKKSANLTLKQNNLN